MTLRRRKPVGSAAVAVRSNDAARITLITAKNPRRLTKRFFLENGELTKEPGGFLAQGIACLRTVCDLAAFATLLKQLRPDQALVYGVTDEGEVELVTKNEWERLGRPNNPVPRTAEHFRWPDGPGILMLDYDPAEGAQVLSRDELIELLRGAVPALINVELLWFPSASSYIYDKDSGREVQGLRGQRVYIMVTDARDIPRAGEAICNRLWLAGYGYFKVSKSGALLERNPIDASVWQTNRLDFAAGAACVAPLEQRRGEPVLVPGEAQQLDTLSVLEELTEQEQRRLRPLKQAARLEKQEEADRVRTVWAEARLDQILGKNADDETRAELRSRLLHALDERVLPSEFLLEVEVDGKIETVSVADVLSKPGRYDRAKTRDPIEPEYDNGRLVGMLFLSGSSKTLHSFARGETTYQLSDGLIPIHVPQGKLAQVVDETIAALKERDDVFDRGDDLVQIVDGKLKRLENHGLDQLLGGCVQYRRLTLKGLVNCDPPTNLSKRILALGASRGLKQMLGVITAPTLRPDGTVLQEPGFDAPTGLFLSMGRDAANVVPMEPDDETVLAALNVLMAPFREFPFVGPVDRSVLLAAQLTASIRWVIPTAPAFGFDAPVQGSGKTLLASAIGALATGARPEVFPHLDGKSDEEARKRLLALFLAGRGAFVWDNILGQFDSAALASALTSETFSDRVLGKSESRSVSSRAMFLLTGNNLTVTGDMARRVLSCRIDPKTEQAALRQFDFDPVAQVLERRQELIVACLTILRGWLVSGVERTQGRMASFELWDDFVRQAVIWIGHRFAQQGFVDPLKAQEQSIANDSARQSLGEFLRALRGVFGSEPFLAKDIIAAADQPIGAKIERLGQSLNTARALSDPKALSQTLAVLVGSQGTTNPAALGRTLGYHKDKIVDGLVLRAHRDSHSKMNMWRVEEVP